MSKDSESVFRTDFTTTTDVCKFSNPDQVISLPMINRLTKRSMPNGFWTEESFNSDLKLPSISMADGDLTIPNSLLFTFQACAPGFLEVALSPTPSFAIENTYQLTFGAGANMKCVIKRRTGDGSDAAFNVDVPARVCDSNSWITYWVCVSEGKVMMGVNDPEEGSDDSAADMEDSSYFTGKNCLISQDDTFYDSLRPSQDRVKFVGLGNFAGLGFKGTTSSKSIRVRKIELRRLTELDVIEDVRANDKGVYIVKSKVVEAGGSSIMKDKSKELMEEWGKECERQKKRAEKFGNEYETPDLESFAKWSEAKMMRSNPSKGFITGIDTESKEEEDKRNARKERFERDRKREAARKRGRDPDDEEAEETNMDDENPVEGSDVVEGAVEVKRGEPLNAQQAYANQWLWKYRVDPNMGSGDAFADAMTGADSAEKQIKEKIHLFCIDLAAFKQIRSDDILAHFADFGPSYVEWLSETSVNVMFEDAFSAARAMKALGQEIPEREVQVQEAGEEKVNEEGGEDVAMDDKEEGAGEEKEKEKETEAETEPGNAMDEEKDKEGEEGEEKEEDVDLNALGWMFCKSAIFKVKDDRFGRRGTRSRFLMRYATSSDVLHDKDDVLKLKLPKNFSRDRVIGGRGGGGGRDGGSNKRQRREGGGGGGGGGGGRRSNHYEREDNFDYSYVPPAREEPQGLTQPLKAARGGFSLDEIMRERAASKKSIDGAGDLNMAEKDSTPAADTSGRWAEEDSD
ncbi:hypothetical protein TrST_g5231 [Triparma strigata]|uniref:Farnesoic acid O-methyl transferase domain-containing protein n=1 Tax=Triparma strigata TaxID=1606541 RepID=A0A9W6ZUS4_9STRA|nr:hypothetical protein TrST_g5231 [Triparma strigata]